MARSLGAILVVTWTGCINWLAGSDFELHVPSFGSDSEFYWCPESMGENAKEEE